MRPLVLIALATLLAGCGPDPELVKMQDASDRQAAEESAQKLAQEAAYQKRAAADAKWHAEEQEYLQHFAVQKTDLQQCTTDYVSKHSKSGLTASDLIEAALSSCRTIVQEIRGDLAAFSNAHFPGVDRRKPNDEAVDRAIQTARGLCFQTLAENK